MPTPNEQLHDILAAIDRPGSHQAAGEHIAPMPVLSVDGVGQLSFPVVAAQAHAVLALADPAPYGRGPHTLVDRDVRRVGQIEPAQITVSGRVWPQALDAIVAKATQALGAEGDVRADLYKLLVYEPGDFFAAHRDSEKLDGMFATLVIVLPAAFSGGELVIRHAGEENVHPLQTCDPGTLSWAAFYADCEHEIRPLDAGYRLCLTYNLVRINSAEAPPRPPNQDQHVDALTRCLGNWAGDWPDKLIYVLEHRYTPPGLTVAGLKNADQAAASVVRDAAQRSGCDAFLAMVEIEERGGAYATEWADDGSGHGYGRRRRWGRRVEATVTAFDVVNADRTQAIGHWRRLDDRALAMATLPFEDFELVPEGALDDVPPDEESFYEATGNEGGTFERSYRRAALVVWPAHAAARVLTAGPILPILGFIEGLLRDGDPRAEAMTRAVINRWRAGRPSEAGEAARRMLQLIEDQAQPALLTAFITRVLPAAITPDIADQLAPLLHHIEWAADPLLEALQTSAPAPFEGWARLSRRLVESEGPAQRLADALRPVWLDRLPAHEPPVRRWQQPNTPINPAALTDLLLSMMSASAEHIDGLILHLRLNPSRYPFDATLIPALRATSGALQASFAPLIADCVTHLEARVATDITPPTHWQQPEVLACKCGDCSKLQRFIAADRRVERFAVAKDRRQHLHRQIDHHGCDMTHVTERKGSPYTLVCTKTRTKSAALARQRQADLAALAELR